MQVTYRLMPDTCSYWVRSTFQWLSSRRWLWSPLGHLFLQRGTTGKIRGSHYTFRPIRTRRVCICTWGPPFISGEIHSLFTEGCLDAVVNASLKKQRLPLQISLCRIQVGSRAHDSQLSSSSPSIGSWSPPLSTALYGSIELTRADSQNDQLEHRSKPPSSSDWLLRKNWHSLWVNIQGFYRWVPLA